MDSDLQAHCTTQEMSESAKEKTTKGNETKRSDKPNPIGIIVSHNTKHNNYNKLIFIDISFIQIFSSKNTINCRKCIL